MGDGDFITFSAAVIMNYRAPADTATTTVTNLFNTAVLDTVQFQIIDVSGKDSRRVVAFTIFGREIV